MSCEEKAMVDDLTELLMNELTQGGYQSPEVARVKLVIFIRPLLYHNMKLDMRTFSGGIVCVEMT